MILIITDPEVGGTFVSWTLHYLAGHETYFHSRSDQWLTVPDNPILQLNAHGFKSNQARCINDAYCIADKLETTSTDQFHHLYFHNLRDQSHTSTHRHENTAVAISQIQHKFRDTILIDNHNPLYYSRFESRVLIPKFDDPDTTYSSAEEQHKGFMNYFFQNSLDHWQSLGLNDIWDQREFLALNIRPMEKQKMRVNVDLVSPHFYLETADLHSTFDQTVYHLFDYLDIKILSTRWKQWQHIYNNWKQLHYNRLMFCWHFDEIINYILHGYDMDLQRFDLDLVQEACIQHHLIYNHNLNFQTFNLCKFRNTKQLHQLLEKNIHPLTKY
jgi:hypothetical protein